MRHGDRILERVVRVAGAVTAGRRPRALAPALVAASLAGIFLLDRSTGSAPVQHLYYLPIVGAAVLSGPWAGPAVALAAIVLYHVANPVLMAFGHREADLLQIALFAVAGLTAARLVDDARRLRRLAATDDLTGLYNLRGFEARFERAIRLASPPLPSLALLVLDVDRLKSLNDTYGHLTGADAVRAVGRVLAMGLPDDAVACRFGGDEFAVALPGHGEAAAVGVADALRRAVHDQAPVLAGRSFPAGTLSISIGIACARLAGGEAAMPVQPVRIERVRRALFHEADVALYSAKRGGRDRVSVAEGAAPMTASGR